MSPGVRVSSLRLSWARPDLRKTGLLGWLSFVINDAIQVAGVALRRTADGRLTLSYPARRDRQGRTRHVLWPVGDEARRAIEEQVLLQLPSTEEATP